MDSLWKVYRSLNPKKGWVITESGTFISGLLSLASANNIVKSHNAVVIPLLKAEGE
jgi:hypothetical protein